MKQKNIFITLICLSILMSNSFAQKTPALKIGIWRGVLTLHEKQSEYGLIELPFNFEIKNELEIYSFVFINAEERIVANEIAITGDSVFIKMPLYDSEFRCKVFSDSLKGIWFNHARKEKNVIPFVASLCKKKCGNEDVFASNYYFNIDGKWECVFSPNTSDSSKAIGLFKQTDPYKEVAGTFMTESGDYRYLGGKLNEDKTFYLSCFDGSHAYLFTGKAKGDSIINGQLFAGIHGHDTWIAKRNERFELRNPDSLTFLKAGYSKIDFSFKNLEGKTISLGDEKFKNKVVIVQLMGTWCPNCIDETKFLAAFYDQYKPKGLEVVGLAFERTDDFAKAVSNLQRLKNRFNAGYEFLITMKTGSSQASEALPMLNKVMAFPTSIYIDKNGVVRKIYTGFYGPATGDNYAKYVEETTRFVEKLLAE